MAVPFGRWSFSKGEIAPGLYGHIDLAPYNTAATTFRNMFVGFKGGAYSRAGTAFVGFSKQTGRKYPPRLVNFQFNVQQGLALEWGNEYMRVISNGAFVTEDPVVIAGATRANPAVLTVEAPFNNGDWISVTDVVGMTQLNGGTYVVTGATSTTVALTDVYGNNVDSTTFGAYVSGGLAARIYTLPTPYSEVDLKYLKFVQSADVMSICCRNQATGTEYAPMDLQRFSDTDFSLVPFTVGATVQPPASIVAVSSSVTPANTFYEYQVTAIDPANGSESLPSPIANIDLAIDISATAGSNAVNWSPVTGVNNYNIYKAAPSQLPIPGGSAFGYAGTVAGVSWNDTNIIPDFQQVPPLHYDPFAPGAIVDAPVTAGGGSYTTITLTINTFSGGSGAVLFPVITNGALVDIIVQNGGTGYAPGDTITVTGDGTGATADLTFGPQSGTYPSVVGYYQQRRAYASSANFPDTYWMTQPGSFHDFDFRVPTIDSDGITGSPWSLQVNGVQWMLTMPGGLLIFTGNQMWQLTGAGGSGLTPVAITPVDQQAQPQAFNGISPTLPPQQIGYDVLFADAVGSNVYDVTYQYWLNIYTGNDITVFSSHLFNGYTLNEWAWCRQPNKIQWGVRSDGAALSLTFVKEQEVEGWTRHDTQGLFVSVCSVIEPPVNAPYFAVQRFLTEGTAYTIERMDNRSWTAAENSWCVDCGLSLPHNFPFATLTVNSATGVGSITGATGLVGGSGYSAGTTAVVVDDKGDGPGTGAVPTLTIAGGVITSVTFSGGHQGQNYTYPSIYFVDPSGQGSGASATLTLNNAATFTASANVFSLGNVGNVIRMGGGIATITGYTDARHVTANITSPILQVVPNSGWLFQTDSGLWTLVSTVPIPQASGSWTMDAPVTTISGLSHLIGMTVTGVADGAVIPPTVVNSQGQIVLSTPATQVIAGLGFQCQLQSPYMSEPAVQGQRKRIARVTARIEASGSFLMGSNQPDAATLSPAPLIARWNNLALADTPAVPPYGSAIAPLYTGDVRIPIKGGYEKPGQAAVQQDQPLPLNILAFVPEFDLGDTPEGGKAAAHSQPSESSRKHPAGFQSETAPPWAR